MLETEKRKREKQEKEKELEKSKKMMESWIQKKRQVTKTEEVKLEERSQTGRERENHIIEGGR